MAKSCNQKGKILHLERMLADTNSEHPISMQEILTKLEEQGIRAERKSIYDDLETLRAFGMEIHYRRGREGGYFTEVKKSTEEGADASTMTDENGRTENQPSAGAEGTDTVSESAGNLAVHMSAPVPGQNSENVKEVKLVCQNSAKKKIQRVFGQEISCKSKGEDGFVITAEVSIDKAFFGWMASMGRSVHILKPKKVAVAYRDYLKNIAKDYKGIDK